MGRGILFEQGDEVSLTAFQDWPFPDGPRDLQLVRMRRGEHDPQINVLLAAEGDDARDVVERSRARHRGRLGSAWRAGGLRLELIADLLQVYSPEIVAWPRCEV